MPAPTVAASSGAEIAGGPATRLDATGPSLFWHQVARRPHQVALRRKKLGIWEEITWSAVGEEVRACGCGLIALGLQPGDRVDVLSLPRPEWFYADLGIQCAGGVTVGIYPTSGASQCGYIAAHSGARIWIVEDQEQYDKAVEVRGELPDLQWLVVIDPRGVRDLDDPTVLTFDELRHRGRVLERTRPRCLEARMGSVSPDDLALLIYTSGTTGPPKGAMHSHRSLFEGAVPALDRLEASDRDETMVYTPMAHAIYRFGAYTSTLLVGGVLNFGERPETVLSDMREIGPTVFGAVPRTWEKLKARIEIGMEESTPLKRALFRWARGVGEEVTAARLEKRPVPLRRRIEHLLADAVVLRKLRERVGLHRVRLAFTGAAPIAPEILLYFRSLGVPLTEGLGQTETHMTAVNPVDALRPGTVGTLLDGVEARTSPEGELLVRGPGLFLGYFDAPEATDGAFEDGWFRTGDAATVDDDGYVTLVGRVVDMFVLSTGRNIAPQNSENMLKASDYVLDAVVLGPGRSYLTALLVLDEETVSHWAQTHDVPFSSFADLATRPEVRRLAAAEVANVNAHWSDKEQIRDFRILRWALSDQEDELTPTMKVRRRVLCERYHELIDEMYHDANT